MVAPFYTIGHGTRPLHQFVELLNNVAVTLVVDVRSVPRSRTNPQYNRDTLPRSLARFEIGYEHIASLGGLRGRTREVPPQLNAFWENASFHNYADYALCDQFLEGLSLLRQLGHEATAQSCARKPCGGAVTDESSPTTCWQPARAYFIFWDRTTWKKSHVTAAARPQSDGRLFYAPEAPAQRDFFEP